MSDFDAQNTDRENSKPLAKASNAGDDKTSRSLGTLQSIALDRSNQNTPAGAGAPEVTANASAGS